MDKNLIWYEYGDGISTTKIINGQNYYIKILKELMKL